MKIGFDAKRLFLNNSGLGNYSRNLVRNLHRQNNENELVLFTPSTDSKFEEFKKSPYKTVVPSSIIDNIFKSNWRSKNCINQILTENLNAYHGLSNEFPATISKFKGKKVVTIHDLIFIRYPQNYSAFDRANYRKKVAAACNVADVIIAISQQTKNDLIEFLGINESKIVVVYQSCEDVFWNFSAQADSSIFTQKNIPANFLLYVGTVEPRKNLLRIVEVMQNIDTKLVVVGRVKSAYGKEIMSLIQKNKIENRIIFLNEVSNAQLAALYSKAHCLIYPSSFEGFGLPVLEAMVCNCPVITGNNSSLIEVGGIAVKYIDVNETDSYLSAIELILSNQNLRNSLISSGVDQASKFLPSTWASKTYATYL